jgi:hypothetical protein
LAASSFLILAVYINRFAQLAGGPFWVYAAMRPDDGARAMTKREAIWTLWGIGLGAVTWAVLAFAFGMPHRADGRLTILVLVGGGLAYLAAKIVRLAKRTT